MNLIMKGSRKSYKNWTLMFDPGNITAKRVNPNVMLDFDIQFTP